MTQWARQASIGSVGLSRRTDVVGKSWMGILRKEIVMKGLIVLLVMVAVIVGGWKMFVKAGKPGWGIIIPIYNFILLLEIAERPIWWILLLLIPVVDIVVCFMVYIEVAKKFGKGVGFGVGLTLLGFIFIPILGFGDAVYQGAPSQTE